MSATIIDGKALADQLSMALKKEVAALKEKGTTPGLVVLLVGDNQASQVYVRNKEKRAQELGIHSIVERLPADISETELLERVAFYNQHQEYHGILVQLPLPKHINEEKIILAIDPKKDVDGFHPINMGKLLIGKPDALPCTPYGIMKMLEAYDVEIAGKQAVVIGRSNIVGKPMAQLLLMKDATVTITHSKTQNLAELAKTADILVAAIGQGHFVTKDFVKPGAVVIDVGMNHDENGKLIGDVKFDEVKEIASMITPVPRGVGPMTITMLMAQTVDHAKRTLNP
ncbi:bifunctional methylenetetrahydrofolate dehydrogenase/methenyltetrahydrofolate cyclohydrolase [Isobaculum melis]|uniref:Bifunctional protein FolD n=1 Tax=Isobaculum melis TaxID=142588 RepID=A0A1H9TW23_9LACT|nr:bifunctional methylenetetrahydrofolate dehydrogenase/methenyltetrahydrofolate cyclohydrolase [Isobaculum melis]SES01580.1 methenyltetrahydrofolate cyclohydrolase /5,10-methylenetetrahydrofolate dehydrogenase (NADP+) [Isobaculum melis]